MGHAWPSMEGNRHFLEQGIALLETLTDAAYAAPYRGHSPMGAQYRHVLEHYQSLLDGLAAGCVNYDARARDARLETDRRFALATTRDLLARLATLPLVTDPALVVHLDSGGGAAPDWRASSLGRELQFLASHTVHHYALIALLLEGLGEPVPDDFGVAPSTLAYRLAGR